MKPIPIAAAERIAKEYGYDQVIIIARKVGDNPAPHGEHVTTYGVNKVHCDVAARIGDFLKYKVMGWAQQDGGA
jgi:acetylornithine/succinyldiaminopimelate/putrescine aminotransferase